MAYSQQLADRVRTCLSGHPEYSVTEKKMFGGLAFMVNGKMCINVSGDNLMCRFPPEMQDSVGTRKGYLPMVMKGRKLDGYCYVAPEGYERSADFDWWMRLCLDFNKTAKASKK